MTSDTAISALVLGAITRDIIVAASGEEVERVGGVVTHAGTALARLGAAARIITRIHADDEGPLVGPLREEGIEVLALPSRATTTYALDYSGDVDVHELRAQSDPISVGDIPEDWREASVIHVGPLHRRDIDPGVMASLHGLIGLDIQGLLREPTPDGTRLAPFADMPHFVEHSDVIQASSDELEVVVGRDGAERFARRFDVRELIITRGRRGSVVITREKTEEIAAPTSSGRYPVGAGDVHLASYLLLRARGSGPREAAEGAARICAAKIDSGQVPKGFRP